jgi:NO-binding membrane sensor protein with MHYT domain
MACLDSGSVSLWQTSGLENGQCAGHIRWMEKTIALSVVVAIIAFVAIYLLFSLRGRK